MPAKLVVIGDSISQGFASLAITRVDESYGAILAHCLGLPAGAWHVPDFSGSGGLPLNLEWLASQLMLAYGNDLSLFEWGGAVFKITELMDQVEDYWERGPGARPVTVSGPYHNLAVWGFRLADAYQMTDVLCRARTADNRDNLLGLPSEPRQRTALRVLNPGLDFSGPPRTQISQAKEIARLEGGIENLIVWLGTNNVLGTVLDLKIHEKPGGEPPTLDESLANTYNLWSAAAFQTEYAELVRQVKEVGAQRVIVATVPHVTIPPITRGINERKARLAVNEKYFDYYTRFWIQDKDFDPQRDPRLLKQDAQAIDQRIDAYNEIIKAAAQDNHWCLVDICAKFDQAAYRRNQGNPSYPFPPELKDLTTQLFQIDRTGKLVTGGLFSLDAAHPTHSGYALVAREFREAMIAFYGIQMAPIDFAAERAKDSLVTHPPRTLDDVFGAIQTLEARFHFSRWFGGNIAP